MLNTFKILVPVFAELISLRVFLHQVLKLHLGFPGFTDYELLLPAPLGLIAFLWSAEKERALSFHFSIKKWALHFLILGLFLSVSWGLTGSSVEALQIIWWLILMALIVSGLTLSIEIKTLLKSRALYALVPALIMVFSLVIYFRWGGRIFENTMGIWAKLFEGLSWVLGLSSVEVYPFSKTIQIYHPKWAIHIGRGCAGFDSLIFFMGAFGVFAPLYWKKFKPAQWGFFFLLGLGFFSFLNFFRILFLFLTGILMMEWLPPQKAIQITLTLFHVHLGYLLYGLGLFSYFQFILSLNASFLGAVRNPLQSVQTVVRSLKQSFANS